jgi:xanthine phosphoribosyltransferase
MFAKAVFRTPNPLCFMIPVSPNKYFSVSWDELHRNAKALASKLHKIGSWKGLIIVTRGGLVPAAIIARELDIRVIETVSVVGYSYDDNDKPVREDVASIIKDPANVGDGQGWLVIDDLVDTGRTAEVLHRLLPKAHFAAIYAKPMGKPLVDTFVAEISQDTWIYFPWDIDSHFTKPIALQGN